MRIIRTVVLVGAAGLLTSCLVFDPNVPRVPCQTNDSCSVSVAIAVQTSPFKCDVDVNPPVLDASGLTKKTITWTFALAVDGKPVSVSLPSTQLPIQFDSSANGVITGLAVSGNTVWGTYTPPNKGDHRYGYVVSLPAPVAAAATAVCKLDPWVVG